MQRIFAERKTTTLECETQHQHIHRGQVTKEPARSGIGIECLAIKVLKN